MALPIYNHTAVKEVLAVAASYFSHRNQLIYAFKGHTFLEGSPLFDENYDGRGNIDCSTYMQLVLQGISYEESPYCTGSTRIYPNEAYSWTQKRLYERLMEDANYRRANEIARSYYEEGLCFEEASERMPGDLVFYQAPEEVIPFYREHGAFREICHVAIVSEDGERVYHSTGLPEKSMQEEEKMEAVQLTPIFQDRTPILFARPRYI